MNLGYQQRDEEVVDYQLYQFDKNTYLRGPRLSRADKGSFFACVGAAQTFGRFCWKPYSTLLQERLGLPVLNLGIAGAGPGFFTRRRDLIDLLNAARFVVLQVMSARSTDNSLFDSGGLEYLTRRSDGQKLGAEPAYRELLEHPNKDFVRRVIAESRNDWVESYRDLMSLISPPKILLWFSKRTPTYEENHENVHSLFGEFPQLVTDWMVEEIKPYATEYVECVSSRGLPQSLIGHRTGLPAVIPGRADLKALWNGSNTYYPSPEMQTDAADALAPVCGRLCGTCD